MFIIKPTGSIPSISNSLYNTYFNPDLSQEIRNQSLSFCLFNFTYYLSKIVLIYDTAINARNSSFKRS